MHAKPKNKPVVPTRRQNWDQFFEYGFVIFLAISALGATGSYAIPAGIIALGLWIRDKNRQIDRQNSVK